MKVLVGIVTRGREKLVQKAINSALAQKPPPDKVWVIEDGVMGEQLKWNGSDTVRITHRKNNRGYLQARMEMMSEPGYDEFVSLDDDAWFIDGDEVTVASRLFEREPKVAAVAFDIQSPDQPKRVLRTGPVEVRMFIGCGHALRLAAVRDVGGYESMPGLYGGEEKDLCLRLMDAGWKIMKVPGTHVWHEKTLTSRDQAAQRREGTLNDLTFIWRRCPFQWLFLSLLGNAISQTIFALRNPLHYLRPTLSGLVAFCRVWPELRDSRRPVKTETWTRYRKFPRAS